MLGIVNFAQGSMLTLAMYVVLTLVQSVGLPVYVATLVAVPLMFALGYVLQLTLLNKLTLSGSHEGPLLITLGLSLLIVNVLLMVYSGRPQAVGSAGRRIAPPVRCRCCPGSGSWPSWAPSPSRPR